MDEREIAARFLALRDVIARLLLATDDGARLLAQALAEYEQRAPHPPGEVTIAGLAAEELRRLRDRLDQLRRAAGRQDR